MIGALRDLDFDARGLARRIRDAVQAERETARRGVRFEVLGYAEENGILTFIVESETALLDPSMEDGSIRWGAEQRNTAEIISIDPDTSQIHAYPDTGVLPRHISCIWINPPQYLEPLHKCWQVDSQICAAMAVHARLTRSGFHSELATDPSDFPDLRNNQRKAFSLTGYDVGFLWGPPGTGKTHTLGRLIAAHILQYSARVLLVSSTNVAVDQAIISICDGLSETGASLKTHPIFRFGSQFAPSNFEGGAESLIPVRSKSLIADYRRTLSARPSPKDPLKYGLWKESLSAVRERIRLENLSFMSAARVAAVTATYAVNNYSDLKESGQFDVIVFDEASQIGKAHALMVAGLGGRLLFAGDPKQLSPIVQSKGDEAQTWLGISPFGWKDLSGVGTVTLNEQSRMTASICRVVSDAFYDRQLQVAPDLKERWHKDRTLNLHPPLGPEHVNFFRMKVEAQAMGQQRRWRSPQSAEFVVRLVNALRTTTDLKNVAVLTPYRAQRAEICQQLRAAGLDEKIVSTIHRAQGSEKLIIVLDPVRPSAEFLNGPEGERLINVAISRAQARLFILVHPDYNRNNTVLARIVGDSPLVCPDSLPQLEFACAKPRSVLDPLKQLRGAPLPKAATQLQLKQGRRKTIDPVVVFQNKLLRYLASGARSAREIKAFAADAQFAKLSFAERERLIAPFL